MQSEEEFETCAARIKALANAERLQLVQALFRGPHTVSELCETIDVEIVMVSHHLGVLREANIVRPQRDGRNIIYSLDPEFADIEAKVIQLGCCRLTFTGGRPNLRIVEPEPNRKR